MRKLETITLRGYKSIATLEAFKLNNINVLIGANGAGKSNFLSVFGLLRAVVDQDLQRYVRLRGGPDAFLHRGRRTTPAMELEVYFEPSPTGIKNGYRVTLAGTNDNRFMFDREETWLEGTTKDGAFALGEAHEESALGRTQRGSSKVQDYVTQALKGWTQFHFHDTSDNSAVKKLHGSNDNVRLKPGADNLAAFLTRLQAEHRLNYENLVAVIRLAAPFFRDFFFREPTPDSVELEWLEENDPATPHRAHLLSDGTLRFMCLTTLLMQPAEWLPATIIIDEPELGLHPYAIQLLADMIKRVATTHQVIVSTQSVELLNAFSPEDIVVVERDADSATIFKRLDRVELGSWLEDYSLGELWQRNILGGRPR